MTESLNQPLALGRTAEVYPWKGDQVLKLFHPWFSHQNVAYEQRIAQAIQGTGLPVPSVGEMITIDGRDGLVYQRLDGEMMATHLMKRPWLVFKYAQRTAELHLEMHDRKVEAEIPLQHEKLTRKIEAASALSRGKKELLLKILAMMPVGDRLCHGDFHPGNILVNASDVYIIDWIDSAIGNPLADVARTTILLLGMAARQVRFPPLKGFVRLFHRIYLQTYFQKIPSSFSEYQRWLPIVAAARLSEGINELENWLVDQASSGQN